jgi:hypothetical protein
MVRKCYVDIMEDVENDEMIADELVKLSASKQKLQDKNNVERKITRENNRLYNHLSELYKEYVRVLTEEKVDLNKFKLKSEKIQKNKKWGILQLSDLHLNKKVEPQEFVNNEYNFTIASKRLKKFITEAIFYFKAKNIKNVYIALTGDLLTSDRRENERLNRITNQTKASLLSSYLLKQAFLELNQHFGVKVGCVVGNESRLHDNMYSDEILATDNYDYLIFNNLRLWLDHTNIQFDMTGSFREKLTTIDSFNLLKL